MSAPTVRPAATADVAAIVAMLREIHAEHLAWDAARWTTSEPPHASYGAWIAELIADPGRGVVLVADVDGVVAGYALAEVEPGSTRHWTPRAVYVHDLFVAETHRRRGIADALARGVISWARERHPGLQLRLMTAAPNEPARAFFARLGFRPCVVEMIRSEG